MPIPVNVIDNKSQVRVKSNCGVDNSRLEALIKQEKEQRIVADENLQATKQEKIQFIYLTTIEGILDSDSLNLLISNKVNRLVLSNVIYYLSIVNGDIRKYFSKAESSVYNEIDVNIKTGEFEAISHMDPVIKNHIEDETKHITEEERLFWNNKVSASADPISSTDYQLNLTID